jgi:hypothetical protein
MHIVDIHILYQLVYISFQTQRRNKELSTHSRILQIKIYCNMNVQQDFKTEFNAHFYCKKKTVVHLEGE